MRAGPLGADGLHVSAGDARADWAETFTFAAADPDGSLGVLVRVRVRPRPGSIAYLAVVVRDDEPVLFVADDAVAVPRRGSLELRAPGLWADHLVEDPVDRWTIGLECFAVALEPTGEVLDDPRGDLVGLGLDLEVERVGPVVAAGEGHVMTCQVHGEVLVGRATLDLDVPGERGHWWGPLAWGPFPSATAEPPTRPPAERGGHQVAVAAVGPAGEAGVERWWMAPRRGEAVSAWHGDLSTRPGARETQG